MTATLNQTWLLVQWQARRLTEALPLLVVVQVLLSVSTIYGYGMLAGNPTGTDALYLATGAPTVALITVGLVMTPQIVAQAKTEGSLDWLRTLPVPRLLFLLSDLLLWTVLALPGVVLGVYAGVWRFDVHLAIAPWLVPAAMAISLTAAAVGYSLATLLKPALANLLTQVLVFVILLFSPISYPVERMPQAVQAVQAFLPFQPMAEVMRAGLASGDFTVSAQSVGVLAAWCGLSMVGATLALRKQA
jgi:ABC-2 type transport system permease protein